MPTPSLTTQKEINLYLDKPNDLVYVQAKQYDALSRNIKINLFFNDAPWTLPGNIALSSTGSTSAIYAMVRYLKPDGTKGMYDTDEENNQAVTGTSGNSYIIVRLAEQVLVVKGRVFTEISFYNADGQKLTSFGFIINVEASSVSDEEYVSSDYYNLLRHDIQAIYDLNDAFASATQAAVSGTLTIDDTLTIHGAIADAKAAGEIVLSQLDVDAQPYSTSATYSVGDYCIRNNKLYRCTTAITSGESWNSAHWFEVVNNMVLVDDPDEEISIPNYEEYCIETGWNNILNSLGWTEGSYINGSGVVTSGADFKYSDAIPADGSVFHIFYNHTGVGSTVTIRIHGYSGTGTDSWVVQLYNRQIGPSDIDTIHVSLNTLDINYIRVSIQKISTEVKIITFEHSLEHDIDSLSKVMFKAEPDKYMWELGSYQISNGALATNSIRLRTKDLEGIYAVEPLLGYSISVRAYNDLGTYMGCWNGTSFVTSTTNDWFYKKLIIKDIPNDYHIRIVARKNDNSAISTDDGTNIIFYKIYTQQSVFHIGDGYEYTRLRDGIAAAAKHPNCVAIVHPGTYDLVQEFATEISANVTDKLFGIELKNNVTVKFCGGSHVIANYTGGVANITKCFNPFYAGPGGYTIDGLDMSAANTRYCIHDEAGTITEPRIVKIKNCRMIFSNGSAAISNYPQCIGGGLGKHDYIEITGCYLENVDFNVAAVSLLSYHNNSYNNNAQSRIVINNCYLARTGRIRFGYLGSSTLMTNCQVSNCNMGNSISVQAENQSATAINMELVEFNNVNRNAA